MEHDFNSFYDMDGKFIAQKIPAKEEDVRFVLGQDPLSDDGRSEFMWLELASGELALVVFPRGDTYQTIVARLDKQIKSDTL